MSERKHGIPVLFACCLALCLVSCSRKDGISIRVTESQEYPEPETKGDFLYKDEISVVQMKNDLAFLEYLLKTSYAGYDEMVSKGFSFDEMKEDIISGFPIRGKIKSSELGDRLMEEMAPYIDDAHFLFQYDGMKITWRINEKAFFSNMYAVKEGEEYLHTGDDLAVIQSDEISFFKYPASGTGTYRIGCLSTDDLNCVHADVGGKDKLIFVRQELPLYSGETPSESERTDTEKSIYIRMGVFYISDMAGEYGRFRELLHLKGNEGEMENLIIDVRSNVGGYIEYSDELAYRFYDLEKDEDDPDFYEEAACALNDPRIRYCFNPALIRNDVSVMNGERASREFAKSYTGDVLTGKYVKETSGRTRKVRSFSGNIYILADNDTASASEILYVDMKKLFGDKVHLVGTNTSGAVRFCKVSQHVLPNSGIGFFYGSEDYSAVADDLEDFHGEFCGFYPEYWSSSRDMARTLETLTGDDQLHEVIKSAAGR